MTHNGAEPVRLSGTDDAGTSEWPDLDGDGRFRPEEEVERHRRVGSDELLIPALARGATYAEAGGIAGVSERTARRRAADPEIVAAVEKLRAETFERATGRLLDVLDDAVEALHALLGSPNDGTRLRAVVAVFDQARAMRETHSIERRLDAIEEATLHEDIEDPELARWRG